MKAYMTLTLEEVAGTGVETVQTKNRKANSKFRNRFERFNNFMTRFVTYHQHESLRQTAASPFIWTE